MSTPNDGEPDGKYNYFTETAWCKGCAGEVRGTLLLGRVLKSLLELGWHQRERYVPVILKLLEQYDEDEMVPELMVMARATWDEALCLQLWRIFKETEARSGLHTVVHGLTSYQHYGAREQLDTPCVMEIFLRHKYLWACYFCRKAVCTAEQKPTLLQTQPRPLKDWRERPYAVCRDCLKLVREVSEVIKLPVYLGPMHLHEVMKPPSGLVAMVELHYRSVILYKMRRDLGPDKYRKKTDKHGRPKSCGDNHAPKVAEVFVVRQRNLEGLVMEHLGADIRGLQLNPRNSTYQHKTCEEIKADQTKDKHEPLYETIFDPTVLGAATPDTVMACEEVAGTPVEAQPEEAQPKVVTKRKKRRRN